MYRCLGLSRERSIVQRGDRAADACLVQPLFAPCDCSMLDMAKVTYRQYTPTTPAINIDFSAAGR